MSTDEQERLRTTGRQIKEKIDYRDRLRKEADTLATQLGQLLAFYKDRNTDEVSAHLMQLPQEDKIVRTFRKLLDAESALTCIQQRLGLTIKEAE